jgi:hypothetical protein
MKNKFLLLTWLLAVPLLWGGCETTTPTPEQQLPGLTTTGENTFGCLVNGEAWLPEGGNPFGPGSKLTSQFHRPTNRLTVSGTKDGEGILEGVGFDLILSGDHEFSRLNYASFDDFYGRCEMWDTSHPIDTTTPYHFEIVSFSLEEKTASGTFSFTAVNTSCLDDTVVISEGRFDVKWAN